MFCQLKCNSGRTKTTAEVRPFSLGAAARSRQQKGMDMYKKIVAAGLALAALTLAPYSAGASKSGNEVRMEDRCEPESFNAVVGEGTCVGNGTTTFTEFAEDLNPIDFGDDHWRFQASGSSIKLGESIKFVNKGGEFHSFTEVAEFKGGCVDQVNDPLGLTEKVPQCADPAAFPGGLIAPLGGVGTVTPTTRGTHLYMCLIHPWMQAEVTVK
jgi:plastocyanin